MNKQELFKRTFFDTTGKFEFRYNLPTGLETRYLLLKQDGNRENLVKEEQIIGTAKINN